MISRKFLTFIRGVSLDKRYVSQGFRETIGSEEDIREGGETEGRVFPKARLPV